jgi:type IV secretory pathway VirB10-like protein
MKRKPVVALVVATALAATVPFYAAAQNPPAAGKKAPAKKKKGDKGAPADSASASAAPTTPPAPPPPPEPASASAAAPEPPPPAASSAPVDAAPPPAATSRPGAWKTTAGIVSIGAGAVFLGGTYLFYKLNVNQNDAGYHAYARGIPSTQTTCDAASAGKTSPFLGADTPAQVKKICSHGKTYTVLEFTSLGLGVVGIGLGVYWLITAPSSKPAQSGFVVLPRVGETTGLDVAFRF